MVAVGLRLVGVGARTGEWKSRGVDWRASIPCCETVLGVMNVCGVVVNGLEGGVSLAKAKLSLFFSAGVSGADGEGGSKGAAQFSYTKSQ